MSLHAGYSVELSCSECSETLCVINSRYIGALGQTKVHIGCAGHQQLRSGAPVQQGERSHV